jgi:hypothetical protein
MSTTNSTGTGKASRTSAQRALVGLRAAMRSTLDPLLPTAAREAIQVIDSDAQASGTLKKSVRRLLVDQREFSSTFFAAVEREIDAAVDELFRSDRSDRQVKDKDKDKAEGGITALSLVDYDQMEENMLLDKFAARIRNAANEQYGPLTQRLAVALGVSGLTDRENPFNPVRFCRALGEAVDKLGFKGDQRLAVVKAFDGALGKPLTDLYEELNRQLRDQGVEERNTATAAFKNSLAGFRNTFVAAGRPTAGGTAAGAITGATAEQLLSALYQRMQLPMVGGAGAATPVVPVTSIPTQPLFDRADFVLPTPPVAPGGSGFANTGLMAPATAVPVAPGTPVQFAAIDPGLLASINEVQRLNALAAVAARSGGTTTISERDEAQLRAHVAERATKQIDKLVIELVGMLFDRIHQDKHLPAEIKTALSRLQFPIMKVALSDSDLFVSPLQPARRLMDRIASTAIGWIPEGEENQRYLTEVNRAVDTVVVAINEGPSIFEKALEEFEKYLNEERSRDDDPITRAKRALEEAETREVMAINAAIGIRRAFDGVQLESYLREFLLDTWVKVLVASTLRERSQPDFAKRFRDMVPDLVWSVQPKINPDDRKRLVKTIPAVLNTLREGLQLIEHAPSQTQEFFTRLMASHAQAVKALEVAYGAPPPVDAGLIKKRLDEVRIVEPPPPEDGDEQLTIPASVVRSAAAANHAEVNVLDAPPTVAPEEMIPVEQISDVQIDEMIEGWERGSWFDLYTGQQVERVRLRWISPRRNFYLFTSAETGKAHSLAPLVLRGYVRAGRIRAAESARLFDRAVGNLMRDLGAPAAQPA